MHSSLSRLAAGPRLCILRPACSRIQARHKHHAIAASKTAASDAAANPFAPSEQITFQDLGLRDPLVNALHVAYPNVRFPTTSQTEFIPAILGGRDVLLKDATGTGKCVTSYI